MKRESLEMKTHEGIKRAHAAQEDLEVLDLIRDARVPEKRKTQRVLALCMAICLWAVVMTFVAGFAWSVLMQFGSLQSSVRALTPIAFLVLAMISVVSLAGASWASARLTLEGGRSALVVARRRSLVRARDHALHASMLGGGLSDVGASLEQRGELSEMNQGKLTRV